MGNNYQEIEKFILKYQTAKNYNSKEIRMSIRETEELVLALSLLLSREINLSQQVIDLQEKLITDNEVNINMNGGNF